MSHYCERCCASIFNLPSYARLCKPCYAATKKAELQALQDEVLELRAEVLHLRGQTAVVAPAVVEPTMLRRLLQLCHPDKHGGSTMAGEVTAWLLSLRRGASV